MIVDPHKTSVLMLLLFQTFPIAPECQFNFVKCTQPLSFSRVGLVLEKKYFSLISTAG